MPLRPDVSGRGQKWPLTITCLAVALLSLPIASTAFGREKQTVKNGANACFDYCDRHNSTDASRSKCYTKCGAYWFCNGSDASDPFYAAACKRYRDLLQQQ